MTKRKMKMKMKMRAGPLTQCGEGRAYSYRVDA
jgi:hypothetical protein